MLLKAPHQEKVLKQSKILKLKINYSRKGLLMKIIIILLPNLKTPRKTGNIIPFDQFRLQRAVNL